MIAGVIIEEGEQFIADGGVYNLIYLRQTKGVFRTVFVKISVIVGDLILGYLMRWN